MKKETPLKLSEIICLMLFVSAVLLGGTPKISLAASDQYVPLAPIEGTCSGAGGTCQNNQPTNLGSYLTGIFRVGVVAAGILAFLMIVWGGFTYLSTDAVTGKEEGKAYIGRAIGGLLLALASYVILYTINPSLVNLDLYFGSQVNQAKSLKSPYDLGLDQAVSQIEQNSQNGTNGYQGIVTRRNQIDLQKSNLDNALAYGAIDQATYDDEMKKITVSKAQVSALDTYTKTTDTMVVLGDRGSQEAAAGNRSNVSDVISYINSNAQTAIDLIKRDASQDPNAAKDANGKTDYDRQINGITTEASGKQYDIVTASVKSSYFGDITKLVVDNAYKKNPPDTALINRVCTFASSVPTPPTAQQVCNPSYHP